MTNDSRQASAAPTVDQATDIFEDLEAYVAQPRLGGLAMSPDGTRLVTGLAQRSKDHDSYVSSLWAVDPQGREPAQRLTRSAEGESNPVFTCDNDLLFTSGRSDEADQESSTGARLWRLPKSGGEASLLYSHPGGVDGVRCATKADVTLVTGGLMPGADSLEAHERLHKERQKGHITAILHDSYPVRLWDHDLGPARAAHVVVEGGADQSAANEPRLLADNLTGDLEADQTSLSPDGRTALLAVSVPGAAADRRIILVQADVNSGESRIVADQEGMEFSPGPISPDSGYAVIHEEHRSTPEQAPRPRLSILSLTTGEVSPLAHNWDRWATPIAWSPDGRLIYVLADDNGRRPVFSIDVESQQVRQITTDEATYSDFVVAPDGLVGYGVRSSYAYPSEVVRVDLQSGNADRLLNPVERPTLPGHLEDVETTAPDGTRIRAWLALPASNSSAEDASPAPLLLWVHGGPLGSWNAWTWRWNPWLLVSEGYAVLLPDPALSTGYGQDFIQRGWGAWGQKPYTDLMAITDAVEARADIDATRTAAMGGSFGGYMANWIAGHTDRFQAIVTHASLWALDQFGPTTDASFYWSREMTEEMAAANSPHQFVSSITNPMLVIHGDKDYRVPIGEGLRLWYELLSQSGLPADSDGRTAHRFLYFPSENHWILTPHHARIWYETVRGFLEEHVRGNPQPPAPRGLGLTPPAPAPADEDTTEAG